MTFDDRFEAGEYLAKKLEKFRRERPLVLAIPRGGVPIGYRLAKALGGELDVVLVHKIGAPDNPEYAIGSVSESGHVYQSEAARELGIPTSYIEESASKEGERLRRLRKTLPIKQPIPYKGRTVIIADDGLATGATAIAAVRAVRAQAPKQIVVAAPVASESAVRLLSAEADKVIVVEVSELFFSVGQFYRRFDQLSDQDVAELLQESESAKAS